MDPPKPVCERCGRPAIVHISTGEASGSGMRHLCLECADREDIAVRRQERGLNHAAILIVAGLIVLVISLFADVLRWGEGEAFGYKQMAGLVLAGGGVLVGAVTRIPTLFVVGLLVGGLTLSADYIGFGKSPGFGLEQVAGTAVGILLAAAGGLLAGRR